jgi:hypothetical protein
VHARKRLQQKLGWRMEISARAGLALGDHGASLFLC